MDLVDKQHGPSAGNACRITCTLNDVAYVLDPGGDSREFDKIAA
jgi:hypothetical protein